MMTSLGWNKEKPLAINDGLEIENIYSGGEDGSKNRSNPMHGVAVN